MHPGHGRVAGQPLRQRRRVALGALHPHVQGAQPAQGEPGLERPRHGTVLAAMRRPAARPARGPRRPRRRAAGPSDRTGTSSRCARPRRHRTGSGRASTGVAKVLSTTPMAPAARAAPIRAGTSTTRSSGLVVDSAQTMCGTVDGGTGSAEVGEVDRPDLQPAGAARARGARRSSRSRPAPGRPRRRPEAPGRERPRSPPSRTRTTSPRRPPALPPPPRTSPRSGCRSGRSRCHRPRGRSRPSRSARSSGRPAVAVADRR